MSSQGPSDSEGGGPRAGPSRRPSQRPGGARPSLPSNTAPAPSSALRRSTSGDARSILASRSPSVRPPPGRGGPLNFRPVRPPPRRVQVKEDPDAPRPASPAGSPAPSPGTTPVPSARTRPPRPRPGQPVMTASGPFARATEAASSRGAGRMQTGSVASSSSSSGGARRGVLAGLSIGQSASSEDSNGPGAGKARHDYREPDRAVLKEREDYSDAEDDGFEIVDMDEINDLDELAPRALPRMRQDAASARRSGIKSEHGRPDGDSRSGTVSRTASANVTPQPESAAASSMDGMAISAKDKASRAADALDLSASEDEEVMDDLLEDFVSAGGPDGFDDAGPENQMYLFQFPPLFPKFERTKRHENLGDMDGGDEDGSGFAGPSDSSKTKARRSVAFADDTVGGGGAAGQSPRATPGLSTTGVKSEASPKRPASAGDDTRKEDHSAGQSKPPEGQIGRLDVFRDGRVHFRFGADLVMDVTGGSQASFLQHVMIIDEDAQRATTLGELRRKFVVAPEIASMLADAAAANGSLYGAADPDSDVDLEAAAAAAAARLDPEGMERAA